MATRLQLQAALQAIIGVRSDGKANVYFQPPESVKLSYPCIIYKRNGGDTEHADDRPYRFTVSYEILLIDKNPDSEFIEKLAMAFPTIEYKRHYVSDNLNHDAFSLFY